MRLSRSVILVALLHAAFVSEARAQEPVSGELAQQVDRGAEAYAQACAACHRPNLEGIGEARALAGPDFQAKWSTLTAAELYDRVRLTMPPGNPGGVPVEVKTDIVTHILHVNGLVSGSSALTPGERLAGISIRPNAPSGAAEARMLDLPDTPIPPVGAPSTSPLR